MDKIQWYQYDDYLYGRRLLQNLSHDKNQRNYGIVWTLPQI